MRLVPRIFCKFKGIRSQQKVTSVFKTHEVHIPAGSYLFLKRRFCTKERVLLASSGVPKHLTLSLLPKLALFVKQYELIYLL